MSVDYREQYPPSQLEPFFPNELLKMLASMLFTLGVIVLLALLVPEGREEPADPRNTPVHIKPEWYFLAVYQSLKLMPQSFLGISGKLLGVLLQGVCFTALLAVPFIFRARGRGHPLFRALVTAALGAFAALTVLGIWPDEGGKPLPASVFFREHWLFAVMLVASIGAFALFMIWEDRTIRRMLDG